MKVQLRARHFSSANYSDIQDCPGARAIKEHLASAGLSKYKVRMGVYAVSINSEIYYTCYTAVDFSHDCIQARNNKYDDTVLREIVVGGLGLQEIPKKNIRKKLIKALTSIVNLF